MEDESQSREARPHILISRAWIVVVFAPLIAAVVVLGLRLNDATQTIHHQERAIKAQGIAAVQNRHVLTELCRTNEIVLGLVKGTETLFKYQTGILPPKPHAGPNPPLGRPLVSRALVPYYLNALNTFLGWEGQLEQQTACERIKRP